MFWAAGRRGEWEEQGRRARERHAAWLTRALGQGGLRMPRIPVVPADAGGFEPLMATVEGRVWADRFWGDVLERPELDLPGER